MKDENATIIEAWNTVLFEKFTRFKHVLTTGLSVHSDELLGREPFRAGSRVLDVGCGFGDSTLAIARQVSGGGAVTGVDCAENFIRASERAARDAGAGNTSFRVADVQTGQLGGPYDHAFSRFGTMFFNLPGAALRNVRRALTPGGKLSMIVWRRRQDNPWMHEAELTVKAIVPAVSHDETDQVHCGPGPFSMSGADLVSELLQGAGFRRIGFERFDAEICIGQNLTEAVDFAMALGPAGEAIRLAGDEGLRRKDDVVAGLKETLRKFERPDGAVSAGSSVWFVTAENPAS
ncbi:MAG TPA: class I SAM-dependent methyltransferase [Polyangiaceae bacterium]|nr:class I SAM-dependent methyltransferase [Polyangiaceae bacterium]